MFMWKETHIDKYLKFNSDHQLEHKLGVVQTLHYHACTVIMEAGGRDKEIEHVNKALKNCGFPDWALTKGASPLLPHASNNKEKDKTTCHVTLPLHQGANHGAPQDFQGSQVQHQLQTWQHPPAAIGVPKDPAKKEETYGAGYIFILRVGKLIDNCHSFYVGQTGRKLKTQTQEHGQPS